MKAIMTKYRYIVPIFMAVLVVVQACGTFFGVDEAPPTASVEAVISEPTPDFGVREAVVESGTAADFEDDPAPLADDEAKVETASPTEAGVEANISPAAEVEEGDEPAVANLGSPAESAEVPSPIVLERSVPFLASPGLDNFSAYRMDFSTAFEGVRQGQPTSGRLSGVFETTREPEARHLRIDMGGDTFRALAALGTIELYDIDNTFYIQNPQDGSWLSVPAAFVKGMLPEGLYAPEENIELPARARPQPGTELINGVMSRRYTFGPDDLMASGSNYDEVEGTIWVATEGNYVVRYEATVKGQHDSLEAGGIDLLDHGTVTMMYELSDINGTFSIEPPAGAQSIGLGNLLFR